MAKSITIYVLGQAATNPPAAMCMPIGLTDDGYTIFAMLVSESQAVEDIWDGLECYEDCPRVGVYATKDHLCDEYPELAGVTVTQDEDGQDIETPRLSGGWA